MKGKRMCPPVFVGFVPKVIPPVLFSRLLTASEILQNSGNT